MPIKHQKELLIKPNLEYLRFVMDKKNYSVKQLAPLIGLTHPTLYDRLEGNTGFRYEEIQQIKATLNMSKKDFEICFPFS